jgi:AcrR family transcriptional regulator
MNSRSNSSPGAERHGAPTRLRADARRNRDRVLAAARELFASDGLSVSLDEIARNAGVGPGTVHRHFPTKEALIAAVAIGRLEQVVAQARSLANADDPGEALHSQLSRMLAYGDDSAPLKGALAGTGLDIRTAAPEIAADLRDAVGLLLTRAQDAGAIRADLTIDDLLALLAGAYHAMQYAGVKTKSRQAQRLTAVLLDGLAPTPAHRV